jgi:aquaporin NIP
MKGTGAVVPWTFLPVPPRCGEERPSATRSLSWLGLPERRTILGVGHAAGVPSTRTSPLLRRSLAEGIATFSLVFAGCGAIVTNAEHPGTLGNVGIALVFGLIIMAMIYAIGHLSGAHINPAVTSAFTVTRHFPATNALAYITAQLMGAVAAALLLRAVWPSQPADLGATVPSVGSGSAFIYEAVITAFLMFVIMAVATDTRAVGAAAAIAVGGTVGLDALFGGPITGASMNPARSFGPALVFLELGRTSGSTSPGR